MRSLTDSDVQIIRERRKSGISVRQLASEYGCTPMTIYFWTWEDSHREDALSKKKRKKSPLCLICNTLLKGHERCKDCTALIHNDTCPLCSQQITRKTETELDMITAQETWRK